MKIPFKSIIEFIYSHRKTLLLMIAVALITLLLHSLVSIWLERRDNFHILSVGTIHALYVEVYGGDIKAVSYTHLTLPTN